MTSKLGLKSIDIPNNCDQETTDSLVYDDWQGQFEFVGNIKSCIINETNPKSKLIDDLEDLNLNQHNQSRYSAARNRHDIIVEESFVSTQSIDRNEPYIDKKPNQLYTNYLNDIQFDNIVPSSQKTDKLLCNLCNHFIEHTSQSSIDGVIDIKNQQNMHYDNNNNNFCCSTDFEIFNLSFEHDNSGFLLKKKVSNLCPLFGTIKSIYNYIN